MHAIRVLLFACILWLIHSQHRLYQAQQADRDAARVEVDTILPFFPKAVAIRPYRPGQGGRNVLDTKGRLLGYLVQTSPQADAVIGYSGPTNTLIAFDTDSKIIGIHVLSSGDTQEHVADVVRDTRFAKQLVGKTWEEAAQAPDIDAVSGATLTSLAITEGIRKRLGGTQPSLRFPDPVAVEELRSAFPTAKLLVPRTEHPAIIDIYDEAQRQVGALVRTSPIADRTHGYQGPTDTLILLDTQDRVKTLLLRKSYDNEQYVSYVREDDYFPTVFAGLSLEELARFDVEQEQVEGVSGATMTSVAIASTLPVAARQALQTAELPAVAKSTWKWRDVGTVLVIIWAFAMCFTRLRSHRVLRFAFQVVLVCYLGFINGDLVSQTLLVGWARSGVPWRDACGLATLTAAALLVPTFSKHQLYCSHLCPFGATQQLLRNRSRVRLQLPRWLTTILLAVPPVLLAIVVAAAMSHWDLNLAALEPFDAFLFRIAGWASISIAIIGLLSACFIPMAYCRFGCPTGAMLSFLRFHAQSNRIGTRDYVAIAMLLFAVGMRCLA